MASNRMPPTKDILDLLRDSFACGSGYTWAERNLRRGSGKFVRYLLNLAKSTAKRGGTIAHHEDLANGKICRREYDKRMQALEWFQWFCNGDGEDRLKDIVVMNGPNCCKRCKQRHKKAAKGISMKDFIHILRDRIQKSKAGRAEMLVN